MSKMLAGQPLTIGVEGEEWNMPKFKVGEEITVRGAAHHITGRQKDPIRGWRYTVENGTWYPESLVRSKKNA